MELLVHTERDDRELVASGGSAEVRTLEGAGPPLSTPCMAPFLSHPTWTMGS